MTDWRPVTACAPACDTCRHAIVEPQPGADNVLCREPRVLAAFRRPRVSAEFARADVCFARWHQTGKR